ncbi:MULTISPECIES: LysR substrate-binding domain-containing protein [Mameliella]|uniref:LysR substrate-binding domain-containing protein n=1 Tax=Mameliella TaxID=1434019 RepID=UPI00179D59F6|nr:LysR substrate-binding domain-containing protein [Mameliella alba]MCR9275412.1 substrate-binding domain-containing protein [Paracoccaceae bacterium]
MHSWLGPFLRVLKDRFPAIDVELTVDLSASLSPSLFSRGLDLTLQSGPFGRQISGGVDLGEFPQVWVAAPGLGLQGRALSLRDIARHPVLTHAHGTLPIEQLRDHIATRRLVPLRYLWVPDPLRFRARYDAGLAPSYVMRAAELAQEVARAHLEAAEDQEKRSS